MLSKRDSVHSYTLVEMVVVLLVLCLIASTVLPSVGAVANSNNLKDIQGKLMRVAKIAHNTAVADQCPVRLRINGTTMIMEKLTIDETGVINDSTTGATTVQEIELGKDFQVGRVDLNGSTSDSGSWHWIVYPDGSSDSGGIEFDEGRTQESIVFMGNGEAKWVAGELPDMSQSVWAAGSLSTRS